MAASSSGKVAYWVGALTGLVCSVALVATLSVLDRQDAAPEDNRQIAAVAPETQAEPAPQPTPEPVAEPEPAPQPIPDAAPEPAPQAAAPEPAPAPEPVPEIAPEPEVEEDAPPANASGDQAPITTDGGALIQHSEFFNGDPDEPVLSIVLIGVGSDGAPTDDVFLLPAPLTVAIDPALEGARDLVLDARDSGFEALASLSSAADIAAQLSRVEGVIGVAALDGSLGDNSAINGALTAIAPRGMVLFDATAEGGAAGFRTAKGMGLAAAALGRSFDETPSSAMVFQSLERAAFDARRTGAFIVVGRAEPAVLTGLRRWLNVKAGKSVAVAPLSEVVRRIRNQ